MLRLLARAAAGVALMASFALAGLAPIAIAHAATTAPARAASVTCPAANLWVNTATSLVQYTVTGKRLSTVPLHRPYGDIAWSANGQVLYAVNFDDAGSPPVLYTLDPHTGAERTARMITGAIPALVSDNGNGEYQLNGLSALPDGQLLVGSFVSHVIYQLDPSTGASVPFRVSFPLNDTPPAATSYFSAGDFLTRPDGDVLALGTDYLLSKTTVFRLHPNNTRTEIGTVPLAFGAAQAGGSVYLAAANGDLLRMDTVPTKPSTAPLHTHVLTATHSGLYGASTVQDSGRCTVQQPTSYTVTTTATSSTRPATRGTRVTYTVTVRNTGVQPYPGDAASFRADLTHVLNHSSLIAGSLSASAGKARLIGHDLVWLGPLGVRAARSATVTVRYTVRATSAPTILTSKVIPTAVGGICTSPQACTVTTRLTAAHTSRSATPTSTSQSPSPAVPDSASTGSPTPFLAQTGTNTAGYAWTGGLMVLLGTVLLTFGRRRCV